MNQLSRNYVAEAAIARYRIVTHGAADGQVLQASGSSAAFVGVVDLPSDVSAAANERVDVIKDRYAKVVYSGVVSRGDPLTSDANGNAVVAAPAAGANAYIIGYAEVSGVSGDVVDCYISPQRIQG